MNYIDTKPVRCKAFQITKEAHDKMIDLCTTDIEGVPLWLSESLNILQFVYSGGVILEGKTTKHSVFPENWVVLYRDDNKEYIFSDYEFKKRFKEEK